MAKFEQVHPFRVPLPGGEHVRFTSRELAAARAGYYLRYGNLGSPGSSTRCLSERLEWMDRHVFLPSTAQVV